jgi:isopropylmalate/homocitrate/citramalate synthase
LGRFEMNKWNNFLHPSVERFPLVEPGEPNLYREHFPYTLPPRIAFEGTTVVPELPDEIYITDTTFRDGQQARPPFSVQQIVDIYKMLSELGGPNGVIRQSEFFLYTEKDREAVDKVRSLGLRYPEVTGWIRANPKDFQLVKDMGLSETGILTSISDYHIFKKMGFKSRREAIDKYKEVVRAAADAGLKAVRCHFEDITRADFWGCVVPFAQELMDLSAETGLFIKIRLCDTMGFGMPWPNAALPRSIPKMVFYLRHYAGIPSERLEIHAHNDFHLVIANTVVSWLYGAMYANTTILGIGERTGNCPMEGAVIHYIGLKGDLNGMNLQVLTELARYMEKETGLPVPPWQPLVGKNFNITQAGIHADGLLKFEEVYNAFDTTTLLGRAPGVAITDKSGVAGIAKWIKDNLEIDVPKSDPGIQKIYEELIATYNAGRVTTMSDEEMRDLVKRHMPEVYAQYEAKKK